MQDQNSSTPNPFATPAAGAVSTGATYYPELQWSAMKTPAQFVPMVTPEMVAQARVDFKVGFHFWDKSLGERGEKVAVDKLTFILLEAYSKLSGSKELAPGNYQNYYSNTVKDTRVEPFTLFAAGQDAPLMSGFYEGKKFEGDSVKLIKGEEKSPIPKEVSFHQHFYVWWVEGEKILDLKLTTMVSREIKQAIADAEARAHRRVKAEKVNLFSLADGDNLWGFQVTKFQRVEKTGEPYKSGEMFLVPGFVCGVIMNEGDQANPALYEVGKEMQAKVRSEYAQAVERRKKFQDYEKKQPDQKAGGQQAGNNPPLPTDDFFPSSEGPGIDFNKRTNTSIRANHNAPPPKDEAGDDLPF